MLGRLRSLFLGSGKPLNKPPSKEAMETYHRYAKDMRENMSWFRIFFYVNPHTTSVNQAMKDLSLFYSFGAAYFVTIVGLFSGVGFCLGALTATEGEMDNKE